MNKLRLICLASGSLLLAGSAVLVACSSEDTVVTPIDAGFDSPADVARPDAPAPPNDGGQDAGPEAAPPFDGGAPLFVDQLAEALCKSAARCCFGDPNLAGDAGLDGGAYDQAKCLALYKANGVEGSLRGFDQIDAGILTLDPQAAGDCLAGAANLACDLPGTALADLRAKCFDAFYSVAPAGAGCTVSAGCGKGLFCNTAADGGAKCEAVRGDGGACGDWTQDYSLIDETCSWRGMGGDRYCQHYADFQNGTDLDAGDWTCQPSNPINGDCDSNRWCKDGHCDTSTYQCKASAIVFPPQGFCDQLIKP